jgi:uncharacterized protein involved in type VI secretion and phage assembly
MKKARGNLSGVVTAIVKSLDDPDKQGRIELQFPWLSDSQRSAFAPVAAAMAGKNRGAFFMPEVDDEVLVAFEHGDFDHPFIIGFLWNGVDTPPEPTPQNRVIVTPGRHTLRFEDKAGAKKVVLKSSSGHVITLDDDAKTVRVATASGNLSFTMDDGAQSIVLSGGQRKLTMSGGTVEVT